MSPMRRTLILLPLLLAACAQGPGLQERLSAWVGRSEADLVAELGVPVRTYETEGRRFLQFEQWRTVAVSQPYWDRPMFTPWGPRYGAWGGGGVAYATIGCDITFEMRERRVASFSFRGEGCR